MKKTPDNEGRKQKNKSKLIDKLRFRIKNKRKSENNNTIDNIGNDNYTIDNNTIDNNIIDNNTNDNNTNDNNTNDNNTNDNNIRDKIRDIRVILNRLGNIVTKKDKKKIKKEFYEIENKNNFSDREKKRFMIILLS